MRNEVHDSSLMEEKKLPLAFLPFPEFLPMSPPLYSVNNYSSITVSVTIGEKRRRRKKRTTKWGNVVKASDGQSFDSCSRNDTHSPAFVWELGKEQRTSIHPTDRPTDHSLMNSQQAVICRGGYPPSFFRFAVVVVALPFFPQLI